MRFILRALRTARCSVGTNFASSKQSQNASLGDKHSSYRMPWAAFAGAGLALSALGCSVFAEEEKKNKADSSKAGREVLPHDHKFVLDKPHKLPLIFSGTANVPLAKEICSLLDLKLGEMTVKTFADGEIGIQIHENVRGKDVFLIQPTSPPGVNDHLMELILMISTFRRASARRITAVIPYYGKNEKF